MPYGYVYVGVSCWLFCFFHFKQKTAYEMRISYWSSDVCSSDLAKYVPRGDNPQWNFSLDSVMSEKAWRQRTARMLRDAPRPSAAPTDGLAPQLADRPEPPTFRFSF